ncbi:aminotransferase class IV [Candidatus Solincola tengchongensis]|uniref:aminotransferase class IV n=1 Tax=Candidatus Solincola tengchongensis TaxID=2900693 RepID=UPI00257CCEB6|nr:aminotransferase class IV [Candidatus Solincola tengchongensis]
MKIYLDGRIMEAEEARIPVTDRGILFGDGLFETIRAYRGKPFRLDRHLKRLREGCRVLRLSGIPGDEEIARAIEALYMENVGSGDAYVRLTVTGGDFDGSRTLTRSSPPRFFILVRPFEGYPPEYYRRGIRLTVSSVRRNPYSPLWRIKTSNYLEPLYAKQEAADRGYDDSLFLNTDGYLAEGSTSNLFLVSGEKVMTPHTDCGILAGITRETVLELCSREGTACEEGFYDLEDLRAAGEVFLTMTTGEIIPVAEVDGFRPAEGCPGPVTSRLSEAYRRLVAEELGL